MTDAKLPEIYHVESKDPPYITNIFIIDPKDLDSSVGQSIENANRYYFDILHEWKKRIAKVTVKLAGKMVRELTISQPA